MSEAILSPTDTNADTDTDTVAAGQQRLDERTRRATVAFRRRKQQIWGARALLAVVVIGGWQWFTAAGWVDKFFYAQPSGIWNRLWDYFQNGTEFGSYPAQIETTMQEALYGFLIGTGVGVVLGVALGMNRFLAEVLDPYIKIVNAVPRIVLGSIFIVAFGVGMAPKVLLAAVLVFFIVFFNAFQGVREVDRNVLNNAKVLGASRWHTIRHVIIPSALTWIIASLHSAFGFAIVGAVVGEVLGAQKGLGLLIKSAQGNFDPYGVFANMFVIAALVLIVEFVIERVERRLLAWRPKVQSETVLV
ncbi:binding-protein-dependent transport systems inner membrane component [Catenulispora acidiphila DSM 44928]|uniref:Binding-protein-dependent transport systems inner membrane component n=1 Tax=Catenulispora acidiphila (strain DSM 44928 / JCM 14897 / NBRC 102108 / NRRL B-24433 / ID139908) TaxID=479433 RepID=C7QAY8_CATAD|nr:ABC transporter permease [Catenulispora acidiphila]ACU74461.1 binding-protein-dependent transport systems inner membrane component [Catenulispora acidiphila DSM 44928]